MKQKNSGNVSWFETISILFGFRFRVCTFFDLKHTAYRTYEQTPKPQRFSMMMDTSTQPMLLCHPRKSSCSPRLIPSSSDPSSSASLDLRGSLNYFSDPSRSPHPFPFPSAFPIAPSTSLTHPSATSSPTRQLLNTTPRSSKTCLARSHRRIHSSSFLLRMSPVSLLA